MRFILAPLVILLGIAVMRYNVQIAEFTGQIDIAEKYLGGGLLAGTYTFVRLFGLMLVAAGVLWIFGIL